MRVIGGEWKGRPLVAPAGRGTRPTSDKVREAMFDVLLALPELRAEGAAAPAAGALGGHVVLDLFAGSGALGVEALSRGADACTFIENERFALRALRANLEGLGVALVGRDGLRFVPGVWRGRSKSPRERRRSEPPESCGTSPAR